MNNIYEAENSANEDPSRISTSVEAGTLCLRVYRMEREVLVAVCDHHLLGRVFREGKLHVEVSSSFFGENMVSIPEVERALEGATIANLVGHEAVACALDKKLVDKENILYIAGVPCAQMVRM